MQFFGNRRQKKEKRTVYAYTRKPWDRVELTPFGMHRTNRCVALQTNFHLYVYLNRGKSNRGSVSVGEPLENFVTTEFSQSYSKDHLRGDTGNSKMTRWMCQPDCGNRIPLFWTIMTTIILYLEKSATRSSWEWNCFFPFHMLESSR